MLSRSHFFTLFPILLALTAGCRESPTDTTSDASNTEAHDHDHADGGEVHSLESAVAEVTSLRDAIRDGFANDDPDAAHGPLHEVGDVLLLIPDLAKKQPVSEDTQAAIQTEVDALMDAFGEVDKTLHGEEGSTYEEESAKIDAALTALTAACGVTSTAEPTSDGEE